MTTSWTTGTEKRMVTDCGREANPHYGIIDCIAVALFPILEGRPEAPIGWRRSSGRPPFVAGPRRSPREACGGPGLHRHHQTQW